MGQKISSFAEAKDKGFVRVIEREQTVFLRLTREKLHAVLFDYAARAFCISYARDNLSELNDLSDAQLLQFYENAKVSDDLFVFGNPPAASQSAASSHYLTAPLKGLLSIITVLGGLAAALHVMQDVNKRTFAWVPQKNRWLVGLAGIGVSTVNLALISTAALCVSGLYGFHMREVLCAVLFALCCAAFCLLLKQVCVKIPVLGSVIPTLITVMVCACPVFFTIGQLRPLSFLLPPTYYIYATDDNRYIAYMLLFTAVCIALSFLLERCRKSRI
jgi:hypothetical protein